ncbi:hypothetical protein CICLE_v10033732mg [Citrus x clementina]|uniref:Uncharacterized protein n=1 Tax=Citrus clementina TaxID=85681 RepID=V4VFP6_CITCL|nr:hypothetical protein CICLE_v10033732mg [Citrus x clementina]
MKWNFCFLFSPLVITFDRASTGLVVYGCYCCSYVCSNLVILKWNCGSCLVNMELATHIWFYVPIRYVSLVFCNLLFFSVIVFLVLEILCFLW